MFLRRTDSGDHRSKRNSSGLTLIAVGCALCVIALVVMAIYDSSNVGPGAGRGGTFARFGLPIGLIVIVIVIVTAIRERLR